MRKISQGFIFLLFLVVNIIPQQLGNNTKLIRQFNFALKSKNHLEGFSKSIGINDFIYHSLRTDVTQGLLTRCTDGNMSIEWETQKTPENLAKGLWFTWIAAVDMKGNGQKFNVFVNDVERFEFISGRNEDRKFENLEGGILEFTTIDL